MFGRWIVGSLIVVGLVCVVSVAGAGWEADPEMVAKLKAWQESRPQKRRYSQRLAKGTEAVFLLGDVTELTAGVKSPASAYSTYASSTMASTSAMAASPMLTCCIEGSMGPGKIAGWGPCETRRPSAVSWKQQHPGE